MAINIINYFDIHIFFANKNQIIFFRIQKYKLQVIYYQQNTSHSYSLIEFNDHKILSHFSLVEF